MSATNLLWLRQDLRLEDNPALLAAAADGAAVQPVYILEDDPDDPWRAGAASRWWLHESLASLAKAFARHRIALMLRRGDPAQILPELAQEIGATSVHWNRCYEPRAVRRDRALKEQLRAGGIGVSSHNASLLFEPWTIKTQSDGPFRVFTPFWKACLAAAEPLSPLPSPRKLAAPRQQARSERLEEWRLQPRQPDWASGFRRSWTPGEDGGRQRLQRFLDGGLEFYASERDRPDRDGTSRLSPHLHWGEIGPRQVWHAVKAAAVAQGHESGAEHFLRELGWREFCHHLLFHFPHLPERNFRGEFDRFPWQPSARALRAWQRGQTGYPIVDAGMRQLWQTGWMHNRVRMIVASFLVKHLLQPWRDGENWFWDTLLDADLANNSAGWQWVAGSGADAAPYFRVFNPVIQGERFDPEGDYVRRFVPEIAALPNNLLHKPWTAPADILLKAKITLGRDYPQPIVEHQTGRERALAAFAELQKDSA